MISMIIAVASLINGQDLLSSVTSLTIIILSVTFFGVLFFILVRNALKRKLDILVDEEKERKKKEEKNY